jgi:hypothetical protein
LSDYNFFQSSAAEVGIIDYDEINADISRSEKKCVHKYSVSLTLDDDISSFTLDMEKRTLNHVKVNSDRYDSSTNSYQFTARRVSPFFACSSSDLLISLVE